MGVHVYRGTMLGALTPICNDCGTSLCFDIDTEEYESNKEFYDEWICQSCNQGEPFNKRYYATMPSQT
jgi:DNA primase catalytic subunit